MVLRVDYSTTKGHVGLSIVQQILLEGESNNIVVKYGLSSLTRTPIISSSIALSLSLSSSLSIESNITSVNSTSVVVGGGGVEEDNSCFLKSCHLCRRPLQFDKDIYMYRGDQGFCSIECRNKQIIVDERKEIMEARKYKRSKIAISQIDCRGCETCKLLQELRQRKHHRTTKQPPPSLPPPILSIS